MSLRFVGFVLCAAAALPAFGKELRVCADPDSMPYSRQDESGFENRLAALAAEALGATLVYTWYPQHRGFVRTTVDANRCDVWINRHGCNKSQVRSPKSQRQRAHKRPTNHGSLSTRQAHGGDWTAARCMNCC